MHAANLFRSTPVSRLAALSARQLSTAAESAAPAAAAAQSHLTVSFRDDVAIVRIDSPNSKVNTLNEGMQDSFKRTFEDLQGNSKVKAIVLISGKADNFIAGADIKMLERCTSAEQLQGLSRHGQDLLAKLESSSKPIVAAINGSCLGGGLEISLACQARVASTNPKTVLAVPEVMLGLLPGAGGTQRLPRLVGVRKAFEMMLTGKNVRASSAKKMGLVDVVADPAALEEAAVMVARELASGKRKPSQFRPGLMDKILQNTPFGRNMMFKMTREKVQKQSGGHYPAPNAIIDVVETSLNQGLEAGYATEAKQFGLLGMTPQSRSLISLFFAQTSLKKNRFGAPQNSYNNIAVIGAGLMGAGIAQVSAEKGMTVFLKDRDLAGISRGERQIQGNLDQKVKRRSLTGFDRDVIMSRVVGLSDADTAWKKHMGKANMVIEAVFEDLAVKHRVLGALEDIVPENCVIASNTSALPITDIAAKMKRPENVVGMHYFSPVDKMPLLEVITTDKTSKEASSAAVEVGLRQGKTVIVVKDGPGFYTTRILSPFMVESACTLQDGVEILALDKYLKAFGFPVGPVTLLDEVGIDVGNHIIPTLTKAFGDRMSGPNPEMLKEFETSGCLGRKSGKGFYLYEKPRLSTTQKILAMAQPKPSGKPVNPLAIEMLKRARENRSHPPVDPTILTPEHIQLRLVLRMVNEAAFCLQDGILSDAVDGDVGAVFGLGFPPFLGGPFRWCDQYGLQRVVDQMKNMTDIYGSRFSPAQLLVDRARANKKFHQ